MKKRCSKCGEQLELAAFRDHPKGRDGKQPACRSCEAAARRIDRSEARMLDQQQRQAQAIEQAQAAAADARADGWDNPQLAICEALVTDAEWAKVVLGVLDAAQRGSLSAVGQLGEWRNEARWARQAAGRG